MDSHSMYSMDILKRGREKAVPDCKKELFPKCYEKNWLVNSYVRWKKIFKHGNCRKCQVVYTIKNWIVVLITIRNELRTVSHLSLGATQGLTEWEFRILTCILLPYIDIFLRYRY